MGETVKDSQGLETLRHLVENQMALENHNYSDAARAIGVTDGAVHQFLHHGKGASVEMCLKLAAYLRLSAAYILRLAGHDDVAALLPVIATIPAEATDPYAAAFSRITASLTNDEMKLVLTQARHTARLLRETSETTSETEVGNRPKPKKKLYYRRRFRHYELPAFTHQLREPLTLGDLQALLAYIPADPYHRARYAYSGRRDNLIWHCCALAGLRISEALHLKLSDIRNGLLYIRDAKAHGSRTVPIVPRLQAAIDNYIPYLQWQLKRPPELSDYLFPGAGQRPLHTPYIWQRFTNAQTALGFQRRYTFHSLRHTYATMLIRAGATLPVVQKLLGHKSITSTQIYLHVADEEARAAALRHPLAG